MSRNRSLEPQHSRRAFLKELSVTSCALGLASLSLNAAEEPSGSDEPDKLESLVDCHLHINHFDRSIEQTIQHMDQTGTAKAFVLPLETGEGGVLLRSETVLHAYHLYPERIIPFCQTDIRSPDCLERLSAYRQLGCRGIGEQKEHVPLNDKRLEAVIEFCDEHNWPITIHFQDGAGGFNQGLADHLEYYLKKYQTVRIIGHAQTWWANISEDVPDSDKTLYPKGPVVPGGLLDRLLGEYPNLYGDMSAGSGFNALSRDEEFTAGFIERNSKQLLFGSDCPCLDGEGQGFQGTCYSMQLQNFLAGLVSDKSVLNDLFSRNALRALEGHTSSDE
ncbi:Amidohydrolase [Thalassoglobus neptunius]|uniref:Amidohydrolase n=1 Tax=Thalassoglobus neptunius TaxID=1938619 RepID=A0A5C5X5L7_9PLAN|nr:twin-arginine translocation signal domain-containing protein [Thalassoglobus neptunius]TWT57543.1 Amidohydrolase [Thalassoglobus neptunius]